MIVDLKRAVLFNAADYVQACDEVCALVIALDCETSSKCTRVLRPMNPEERRPYVFQLLDRIWSALDTQPDDYICRCPEFCEI